MEKVAPEKRAHPDVLEARWQVYANLGKWEGALEIATAILALDPERPQGWIYRASSLNELGRPDDARGTLMEAAEKFPLDEIILYDLACVSCRLGKLEEAQGWLAKAIEIGGKETKLRALEDPDLEAVWLKREP